MDASWSNDNANPNILHETERLFFWTGMVRVGNLLSLVSGPMKRQRRPSSISTIHTLTLARSPVRYFTFSFFFSLSPCYGVMCLGNYTCTSDIERDNSEVKYIPYSYHDVWQVARKIGDPDAPRPWSRHSLKKPEYDSKSKPKAGPVDALLKDTQVQGMAADVRGSKGSVANDPKFQEFLEVMQPRSKAKMWANDTTGTLDTSVKDSVVATKESKRPQKNVPVSENDASSEDSSDEEMKIDSSSEDASEELQTAESKQDNDMTDADFFKSKIKKNWSDSESDDEDSGDNSNGTTDDDNLSDESQDAYNQSVDLKGGLDKKINVDKDTRIQLTDSREVDDHDNKESEDLDGRQKETKVHEDKDNEDEDASSITDEKKLALETGRLFFCNLPYATTYVVVTWLC
jgi:multiple RNA-binding domain-containing protein 1